MTLRETVALFLFWFLLFCHSPEYARCSKMHETRAGPFWEYPGLKSGFLQAPEYTAYVNFPRLQFTSGSHSAKVVDAFERREKREYIGEKMGEKWELDRGEKTHP